MSTEVNKAIVRRFFKEAFEQGDLAVLDQILAPNQVNSRPGTMPGMPTGQGRPAARATCTGGTRA
jgi:ketosteroid isomerase-like protein